MTPRQDQSRNAGEREISAKELKRFVRDLYRRRWIILGCTVVVTLVTAFWVFRQPKIYRAAAVIEYDPTPPRPLGSSVDYVEDPVEAFWLSQEFYETQNRILASQSVAEQTVRRLSLNRNVKYLYGEHARSGSPKSVSQTAGLLRSRLSVEMVRSTRLATVRYDDTDPRRAAAIVNTVIASFIEKSAADRVESTLDALDWLGSQLGSVREQLESSELALHDFKQDNNILSVSLEDRQNMITNELEGFTEALTQTRTQRISVAARVAELRNANRGDPLETHAVAIDEHPEVASLRERFRVREAECDALATRYGEQHPEMVACSRELESIRDSMRRVIDGILRSAESTLREVQQIERGIGSSLEQVNRAGLDLNLREIEYQRLLRQRETQASLYGNLLQRTAETNLTRFLRVSTVRVVDQAEAPVAAHRPRKLLTTGIAMLAGLALGLVVALILRMLDRTLASAEELSSMDLTLLGVVPEIGSSAGRIARGAQRRRRGKAAEQPAVGLRLLEDPRSPFAESFRLVRTNLTFLGAGKSTRCILVTSAAPGDGKTTVSVNLAASLAQNQLRVLLVDTDMRRPTIHRALGIPNIRGVSNRLIGEASIDECVVHTEVPGLDVLTCGPNPPNPSELLDSEAFSEFLAEALAKYDRVILDSPPAGVVADATILAAWANVVVVVARPGKTPRDLLLSSIQQLRSATKAVVGCVVNAVRSDDLSYGSSTYYYRRSGYYANQPGEGSGSAT